MFWTAVRELDPAADDESHLAGAREGHLGQLFRAAGLRVPCLIPPHSACAIHERFQAGPVLAANQLCAPSIASKQRTHMRRRVTSRILVNGICCVWWR